MSDGPHVRDAASILVYRDEPERQLFMVRRHAGSAFMANAMVFPGGQIEDGDLTPSWDIDAGPVARALEATSEQYALAILIAAVRETFEEAGLLFATRAGKWLNSQDDTDVLEAGRDRLNSGTATFAELVTAHQLQLQLNELHYFSRWVTPPIAKRRFDARFFIARAPSMQAASPDHQETSAGLWLSPENALTRYDTGEIELAPPTLRILMEIASEPALLERPTGTIKQVMAPQPTREHGELNLVLPGDPAYDPPGVTPNRIIRRDDRWVSIGRGV